MLNKVNCKCEVLKNFSPSWFASVMGTGIVGITTMFYSSYIPFLKPVSTVIVYFNIILFFLLLIPWLIRWIFYTSYAIEDLNHPVLSNFYATIGIAMLVLAANFLMILKNPTIAAVFWIIGTIITLFFAIFTPYLMFKGTHIKLDHINPAFFIPPVGLIVIPIAGSFMVNILPQSYKELILIINYISWGSGFFLYISLLAICLYRFILHHPLPEVLAPTIWISLGPIGAGTISFINLINHTSFIMNKTPFFVSALFLWGYGIWWLVLAILMTLHYIKNLKLPYALSWWAFTFPLGAYVGSCRSIYNVLHIKTIDKIGLIVYILLMFLWTITLIKTIIKAYTGELFSK